MDDNEVKFEDIYMQMADKNKDDSNKLLDKSDNGDESFCRNIYNCCIEYCFMDYCCFLL